MKRLFLISAMALSLSGCALPGLLGSATPPQAPAAVNNLSRSAVEFAANSFDAALYGLDALMDVGKLKPGSPQARQIAALGRKVEAALAAADMARKLGNEPSYNQAFEDANTALSQFRALLGAGPTSLNTAPLPAATRAAILARASEKA